MHIITSTFLQSSLQLLKKWNVVRMHILRGKSFLFFEFPSEPGSFCFPVVLAEQIAAPRSLSNFCGREPGQWALWSMPGSEIRESFKVYNEYGSMRSASSPKGHMHLCDVAICLGKA
jgi:hypothetical protein